LLSITVTTENPNKDFLKAAIDAAVRAEEAELRAKHDAAIEKAVHSGRFGAP